MTKDDAVARVEKMLSPGDLVLSACRIPNNKENDEVIVGYKWHVMVSRQFPGDDPELRFLFDVFIDDDEGGVMDVRT